MPKPPFRNGLAILVLVAAFFAPFTLLGAAVSAVPLMAIYASASATGLSRLVAPLRAPAVAAVLFIVGPVYSLVHGENPLALETWIPPGVGMLCVLALQRLSVLRRASGRARAPQPA